MRFKNLFFHRHSRVRCCGRYWDGLASSAELEASNGHCAILFRTRSEPHRCRSTRLLLLRIFATILRFFRSVSQILEGFVDARVGFVNLHLQVAGLVLSVRPHELEGAAEVVH